MLCKICHNRSEPWGSSLVLSKHQVSYFRCTACGFIQTEDPYWLDEAYTRAIARQDVGIMLRNETNVTVTSAVLKLLFPEITRAVDFGGGHGVFVRMMRDRGYDFHWRDLFASNDFANGFEYDPDLRYDFMTSFEVLEHFVDPLAEVEEMMRLSPAVFTTTLLVPDPPPPLGAWWYYSPASGQHVSLYTRASLQQIAKRMNCNLLTSGPWHLFTKNSPDARLFQLAVRRSVARVVNLLKRRRSLIEADYEQMSGAKLR